MFSWLKRQFTGSKPKPAKSKTGGPTHIRSKFDAASDDKDNRNHWHQVDFLSPTAAVIPAVRRKIRERARYEVANNSVAFGVATTRTHDLVGSGPRPSLSISGVDSEQTDTLLRQVEDSFCRWCAATGYAESLRVNKRAELIDGESFALVTSNPQIPHPVKLFLRPFEADRVCNPTADWLADPVNADGITHDDAGNPVTYTVLRQHPGDSFQIDLQADDIPAADIFHFYRVDRPGQTRGVSWLTPALTMFAILRRYSLAVLGAAETAANIAVLIEQAESGIIPEDDGADGVGPIEPYVEFSVPKRGAMALPPGAKASQMRSEHATTAYGEYRREVLNEIGRCLDMPLNAVSGNSSGYNFASAKIDFAPYHRKLWIEREKLAAEHLHRLFRLWLDEAVLVGEVPDGLPPIDQWCVDWNWDGFESGDPLKEAQAIGELIGLNVTDLAEQCAARGRRWQEVLTQRKKEQDFADRIGLRIVATPSTPSTPSPAPQGVGVEDTAGVSTDA